MMLNYDPRNVRLKYLEDKYQLETDACLEWPFSVAGRGYGVVRLGGRQTYAHRVVCWLRHGDAPPGTEAAHSCGNRRCINKLHLRWATPIENCADKVRHGTNNDGEKHGLSKLSNQDAAEIRKRSSFESQANISRSFGVSRMTISRLVRGLSYREAA